MTALRVDCYDIPNVDYFEAGKDKKYLGWFPVSAAEARNLYREEIRALLPKPKAEKKAAPGKTAKGKKQ
jgi:hypothetical protein